MNPSRPRNVEASVRQRLLNLARKRGEDFQVVVRHYALERFLYRLSRSDYRHQFVVKGAMLFSLWSEEVHRMTWDLDLLGFGEGSPSHIGEVFRELCQVQVEEDGLVFVEDSVRCTRIKENQVYEGVRVSLLAHLGKIPIPIQVDLAFGDAVVPTPREVTFSAMLSMPTPCLRAYPREGVVAEKFQSMVTLGMANSRMKDFYDVWILAKRFRFEGETLCAAIQATFARRRTPLQAEPPLALTPRFFEDPMKQTQWAAFVRKGKLISEGASLAEVTSVLMGFLLPPALSLVRNEPFNRFWPPGGPWQLS